ncbi:hypothetical protein [Microbacterium sp. CPCC 204701]|uniref:hypothetical protein n=1 Tax=Microbacterium sp. CPCC 204701 TaxID=2493084 RepID=UPI000FD85EEC|nr:hypothetical protein [Microbacterium sp. CPCC 204701]
MDPHPRPNYSARDDLARIVSVAPTQRRRDLTPEIASGYWRDVHGVSITACGHLSVYFQHHLENDRGHLWPILPGISSQIEDRYQLDGLAEFGWASVEDSAAFGSVFAERRLSSDEQNIFESLVVQTSAEGQNKTLVDSLPDPYARGTEGHLRVFLAFRRAEGVTHEAFRVHLRDRFLPPLADLPEVLRLRYTFVDDFMLGDWDSPNVDNDIPVTEQYQAFIEVVVRDATALNRVYTGEAFAGAAEGLSAAVRHVNAYRSTATYGFVFRKEPTLIGRYGVTRAALIEATGATNMID